MPPYENETVVKDIDGTVKTDGVHLYFYNIQGELHRADLDGSNIARLPVEQAKELSFDEDYLYYCRYDWSDNTDPQNGEIYRLKKDLSAEPELLFQLDAPATIYPLYQSDILFVATQVGDATVYYTVKKDGTELRRIDLTEPLEKPASGTQIADLTSTP
jgi:hypothetical protein